MNVTLYARVSTEAQTGEGMVSIQQQLIDMYSLVERQGWKVFGESIDAENYTATLPPSKGKVVNPSGERADRPALLAMLEKVKTGDVDAVLCWRDDRLVRHPRVAVALEDALDIGDGQRNGRGKVQIYDATGATIDRFTLSIKATIWREENKRRVERGRMGKEGTLKQGRWPASYNRLGYRTVVDPGKRGRRIELGDEEEVRTVRDIFDWYLSGISPERIRDILIARGAKQQGKNPRIYDWNPAIIRSMIHARDYTGEATWTFDDGTDMSVEIPAIISPEKWRMAQETMKKNARQSTRNAHGVYLLQGLATCGECGGAVVVIKASYCYYTLKDGTRKRYLSKEEQYRYRCAKGNQKVNRNNHPRCSWSGPLLDWATWRKIIDDGIKQPLIIQEQVLNRRAALKAQGDSLDGDIARIRARLDEIKDERAAYQRMSARKRITEDEFNRRMDETDESSQILQEDLARLKILRDDRDKTDASLRYTKQLFDAIRSELPEIDQPPEVLKAMPEEDRRWVLERRQEIVRAMVDRTVLFSDGTIRLEGLLDGTELSQFGTDDS
jgi:DNA invertase Pin-like site-specific DNA recombinase